MSARGIDDRLQSRELRMNAYLRCLAIGDLELVGGVDFRLQLDGFHRRALQAQGLDVIAALACDSFNLQAAGERIRVVLQRDNPEYNSGVVVDQDDSPF